MPFVHNYGVFHYSEWGVLSMHSWSAFWCWHGFLVTVTEAATSYSLEKIQHIERFPFSARTVVGVLLGMEG
jgi:hypothetical protein